MSFDLGDYVDVAERIRIFREKHPEGSLQSNVEMYSHDGKPYGVLCQAWAYRKPDDERPGVGHSWLAIPGTTPYTRGSEVENAETSAWGRAIVAALAADTKKVASADEVRSKREVGPSQGAAGGAAPKSPPKPDGGHIPSPPPSGTSKSDPGAFAWKYGPHAGKTIADTPLDYVTDYAESGKVDWLRDKCKAFLEQSGSGSFNSFDDEAESLPF